MAYDELIGEIYWVIGKIQPDPELEEQLQRLKSDIRKDGIEVTGGPYLMSEETDARIEINRVTAEFERTTDQAKESDIHQHLLEMKAELEVNGIIDE